MTRLNCRLGFRILMVLAVLALVGCGSGRLNHAPVEDRQARSAGPLVAPPASAATVKQPQGFENAGKPGYYTVKPGDMLIRIALENGQAMQDIARWSHVENPNRIEVGQVLRVVPPFGSDVVVNPITRPVVTSSTARTASPVVIAAGPAASASTTAASASTTAAAGGSSPVATDSDIHWIWPTSGAVLAGFDEVKNKGVDLDGKAGDPVLAAADGRVVYVGAGLRGYGNLIILKHDNVFLTAYAHNQTLLVKEDQSVQKGQRIAEMGHSDADRVKLHFEVRRQGKPVDPIKYLPPR